MKIKIGNYPAKGVRRKIDIKIDRFDTWSLDHTLALIIYPALLQLKHEKQGVPNEFATVGGEDYLDQLSFDFYIETHNDAFEEGIKEWDIILDKMIWSFYQIAHDDYNELYHHGKPNYNFVKSDTTITNPVTGKQEETFEMEDKNPGEHWFDSEGLLLHEERVQEGLVLFGKYFRSLWD